MNSNSTNNPEIPKEEEESDESGFNIPIEGAIMLSIFVIIWLCGVGIVCWRYLTRKNKNMQKEKEKTDSNSENNQEY